MQRHETHGEMCPNYRLGINNSQEKKRDEQRVGGGKYGACTAGSQQLNTWRQERSGQKHNWKATRNQIMKTFKNLEDRIVFNCLSFFCTHLAANNTK